jgi:hypothetical protein
MDGDEPGRAWRADGFAVLPGYLPADELAPALAELDLMFPSADGFHDRTDPRYGRYLGDEFAGIDAFPFASAELSLLAVHDRLAGLAETLLAEPDIRIYSAEAWAKYTGAADYDQALHRDYLNQTVLVPMAAPAYQQLEMFVYLVHVPDELGPPHFVSRARTAGRPAKPNWYPRAGGSDGGGGFVDGSPELYAAEVSAAGPAGTVVAFGPGTFHRGTALTAPRGARYTLHLGYRPAAVEWGHRHSWAHRSHDPAWYRFVARASPRQLRLFGFPPPGHPFWTRETVSGMAQRYPGRDWSAWLESSRP